MGLLRTQAPPLPRRAIAAAGTGGLPSIGRRAPALLRWRAAGVYAVPLALLTALAVANLHAAGLQQDEGALLVYADRVLHGAVAHRDFETYYGPGMPWVLAGAFLVAGHHVIVERLVGVALELMLVAGLTSLGLRFGKAAGLFGGIAAAAALGADTPPVASPWIAALAFGVVSLVVATSSGPPRWRSTWRYAVAGGLAALAVTFRIDFAVVAALAAVPLVVGRRRALLCSLAGGAVGLVPLAVHVVVAGPATVFNQVVVAGLFQTSAARRLPLPPTDPTARVQFVLLCASLAVDVLAAALLWRRAAHTDRTRALVATVVLAVAILPETVQRADTFHLLPAVAVAVGLLAVAVPVLADRWTWRIGVSRTSAAVAYATCLGVIVVAVAPSFAPTSTVSVGNEGRSFPISAGQGPNDVQTMLTLVDRIARPGQRLFVGPADMRRTNYTATYLYFLLPQLVPATYYLEMEPLSANAVGSQLAANVASADILVLTSEFDQWHEPNRSSSYYGPALPNDVVRTSFCLRSRVGVFSVFTRCDARV